MSETASNTPPEQFLLGWEEWLSLPELGLPAIKAKIDTGARTSALHAFQIEPFGSISAPKVRFGVHPVPGRDDIAVFCSASVIDRREITSSNGERELRYVIATPIKIGERRWPIEITLTDRSTMSYRMLLGRQAIQDDIYVDPTASFRQPKLSYKTYRHAPRQTLARRALRIALVTAEPSRPSNLAMERLAAERGHVLERLDCRRLSLRISAIEPQVMLEGQPLGHYDAVIPRLGGGLGRFATAAVRQFELMGAHSINPSDALERCLDKVALLQHLARHGVPGPALDVLPELPAREAVIPRAARPPLKCLVVGGRVIATLTRRHGKSFDAGGQRRPEETALAQRAARVLGLGLVTIEVAEGSHGLEVVRVSTRPALASYERVTGARAGEAIIACLEAKARAFTQPRISDRPATEGESE